MSESKEVMDVEETTQDLVEEESLERDEMIAALARKTSEERSEVEEQEEEDIVEDDNDKPEMVELKVDGETILKSAEEVEAKGGVVAYQMTLAADKRFKEAAREKEDIARQRSELQRYQQELQAAQEKVAAEPEISDDAINDFIANVYSGDEDKARESFKNVVKGMKQPVQQQQQIDPEEAVTRALFKIEKKQAANDFEQNYSHLNEDSRLRNMVNDATIRIMKQDPNKSPSDVIVEAAEEVEQWVQTFRPQEEDIVGEQINRKKSIKQIKAAKARTKPDQGYIPKTQAEIFAERKANQSR